MMNENSVYFEDSQSTVADIWLRTLALDGPAQLVLNDKLHKPFYLLKKKFVSSELVEEREIKRAQFVVNKEIEVLKEAGAGARSKMMSKLEGLYSSRRQTAKKDK